MSALAGREIRSLQFARLALWHHHSPLEDADALAALVERAGLDGDDSTVGLARRLALVEHGRLRVDGVAVKRRMLVLERFDLGSRSPCRSRPRRSSRAPGCTRGCPPRRCVRTPF